MTGWHRLFGKAAAWCDPGRGRPARHDGVAAAGALFARAHRQFALRDMRTPSWLLALIFFCVASFVSAAPAMHQFSESEIRQKIVGKVVTDGAHWSDHYLPDGRVDGHSLGKRYTGTWRIEDGQLCTTRQRKKALQTECFEVWGAGTQIEYRRGGVPISSGELRRAP